MASSKIKPENFFAAIGVLQEEAKAAHNAAVEGILESNNTKRQVEDLLSIIGYNKERDNVLIGSFIRMRENIDSLQSQIDGLGESILKLEKSRENKLNVYEAILRHDRNIGGKSRDVGLGRRKGVSSPLKPPSSQLSEKEQKVYKDLQDKIDTGTPEESKEAKVKLRQFESARQVSAQLKRRSGFLAPGLGSLVGGKKGDSEETAGKGDTQTPMSQVLSNALGGAKTDDGEEDDKDPGFMSHLGNWGLMPLKLALAPLAAIGGHIGNLWDNRGKIGETLGKFGSNMMGGAKDLLGKTGEGIKNITGNVTGAIGDFGKNFMGGAKNLAGNVSEGFKNVTGNIGGAIGGMKDKAGGWIKGLFGGKEDKNENIDPEKIDAAISPDSSEVKPRNAGVTGPPPPPSPNLNTIKLPDELQDLRKEPNKRVDYQMRVHTVEATLPINPYALELLESAISNGID
jgi:hypothetical protein